MLDSKNLRENIDTISSNLKKRKFILDKSKFLSIDKDRKEIIVDTENLKNKRNVLSKEIGILKSKNEDVGSLLKKVEEINNTLDLKQGLLENAETQYNNFLLDIPNILDDSVPIGNSDKDNKVIKYSNDKNLEILNKNSNFKDHSDIGKSLKLYDQEIAAKISSSRFSLLFGELASLHRAVAQFMINEHINHNGYTEVNVPLIVNSDSLLGTGQLPKFKDDLFEIKNKKDFFLIPTAEVPLTNIFQRYCIIRR
jgi:seryl-tRNA synthetase